MKIELSFPILTQLNYQDISKNKNRNSVPLFTNHISYLNILTIVQNKNFQSEDNSSNPSRNKSYGPYLLDQFSVFYIYKKIILLTKTSNQVPSTLTMKVQ